MNDTSIRSATNNRVKPAEQKEEKCIILVTISARRTTQMENSKETEVVRLGEGEAKQDEWVEINPTLYLVNYLEGEEWKKLWR